MAKTNPLKRSTAQQKQYIEHTTGTTVAKKGGKGTHDPEVVRGRHNALTVTGGNLNMDGTSIVRQRALAPDDVVKSLINKTGRNVHKLWDILEKSRAAYRAGKHTHRDKLLERHKKQVQKQVLANEKTRAQQFRTGATLEESLRGLMYGHRVTDTDVYAQEIWYQFRDKINEAVTSPDALDTIRVAYKVAELYDWMVEEAKDPPPPPPPGTDEDPPPPEDDELPPPPPGQEPPPPGPVCPPPVDNPVDLDDPPPPPRGKGKTPDQDGDSPPEKEPAPDPDNTDEIDETLDEILDPFNTKRVHKTGGSGGITDAGGSYGAGSGATEGGMTITNPEQTLSKEELREKLKQVLAEKQEQAKQDAIRHAEKKYGSYGIHDYEFRIPDATQTEPLRQSDAIKMVLSETRGRTDQQIGRRGRVTGRAWQASALGNMNVFRKKPNTQGDIVILVDMSGSMGCGCGTCSGEVLDMRPAKCTSYYDHIGENPDLGLSKTGVPSYRKPLHSPCTGDPNWDEARAKYSATSNGKRKSAAWLAKQTVSAITERFPSAKVYGFSDGSETGTVIAPLEHRKWLNDSGRGLFGGGTPTCGGLQFVQDAISGSASSTTAILIMDGGPWYAGAGHFDRETGKSSNFKSSSLSQNCDRSHYAQQCAEFVKRGMGFGIVEVGLSAGSIASQLDVPVGSTAVIKTEGDLMNLVPLFSFLDGRNG